MSEAGYAHWLSEYQHFDASDEGVCYRCGNPLSGSCGWCGVFVCLECSQPDEDDDTVCDECVKYRCTRGVHQHSEHYRSVWYC